MVVVASARGQTVQSTNHWKIPKISPTIKKITAATGFLLALATVVSLPVSAGAVAVTGTVTALSPLLALAYAERNRRSGPCTNATTASNVAVQLDTNTISQTFVVQSLGQNLVTGTFLEAFASPIGINLSVLSPKGVFQFSFNLNYQAPGTGATIQDVALVPLPSGNTTVSALYTQGGTGKNVFDFSIVNTTNVLSTTSTVLTFTGDLAMSAVSTTAGVLVALVSASGTSIAPTLLLYPPSGGTPTSVSLFGAPSVTDAAVSSAVLPNGNIAVFFTDSGLIYGSVVTPTGSNVVTANPINTVGSSSPISVAALTNGNIVFTSVNSSGQVTVEIIESNLTTGVFQGVVDGCTGESETFVVPIRNGFGVFVENGSALTCYYFGPTGTLLGKVPVSTNNVASLPVSAVSPLVGPLGKSQVMVSIPQSGGTSVVVDLSQIDAAPLVATSISSPVTFPVEQPVAVPVSFTDADVIGGWNDTLSITTNATTAGQPFLSYNGTHLIGTAQPNNRGNVTGYLTATDSAGLTAVASFNGTVPDAPLQVGSVPAQNITLGYPFSWQWPVNAITSIYNDTLDFVLQSTLPIGLYFNATTQVISGTAASTNGLGIFSVVIEAFNYLGTSATNSVQLNTVSLPPQAMSTLPSSINATVGAYVLNLANLVTDVFTLNYGMTGNPSSLSIGPTSGLLTADFAPNDVGIYPLVVNICDLFKCLVWKPQLTVSPVPSASPPPATPTPTVISTPPSPTPPGVGVIPYGKTVKTGSSAYIDLSQVFTSKDPLTITASFDPPTPWMSLYQDPQTGLYSLVGNVPYSAEQFTVYLNATSAIPGPNGQQLPVATAEFIVGITGISLPSLITSVVFPVFGFVTGVASCAFAWRKWRQRAITGKALVSRSLTQIRTSLSRRNSTNNTELQEVPSSPPPYEAPTSSTNMLTTVASTSKHSLDAGREEIV